MQRFLERRAAGAPHAAGAVAGFSSLSWAQGYPGIGAYTVPVNAVIQSSVLRFAEAGPARGMIAP